MTLKDVGYILLEKLISRKHWDPEPRPHFQNNLPRDCLSCNDFRAINLRQVLHYPPVLQIYKQMTNIKPILPSRGPESFLLSIKISSYPNLIPSSPISPLSPFQHRTAAPSPPSPTSPSLPKTQGWNLFFVKGCF